MGGIIAALMLISIGFVFQSVVIISPRVRGSRGKIGTIQSQTLTRLIF